MHIGRPTSKTGTSSDLMPTSKTGTSSDLMKILTDNFHIEDRTRRASRMNKENDDEHSEELTKSYGNKSNREKMKLGRDWDDEIGLQLCGKEDGLLVTGTTSGRFRLIHVH
jgi:hypothetical protein